MAFPYPVKKTEGTVRMAANGFERYFTLEEAAAMIPGIKTSLESAQRELGRLRDEVILYQRLMVTRQEEGDPAEQELRVLKQKVEAFEEALTRWVHHFGHQGLIIRDLDSGLVDFPYYSITTGSDFLLCWQPDEEGIFYFHSVSEGFKGRKPITLLPE